MSSLQARQLPIDTAIVNAMVESTPETWKEIVLTLVRLQSGEASFGNFSHELSSPEGYPPVGVVPSLFEATYELDELLQSKPGGRLLKAVYTAKAQGGNWSYQAKFEYAHAL